MQVLIGNSPNQTFGVSQIIFEKMNSFKLFNSVTKDISNVTGFFFSNKMCSFELSIPNPEKKCIMVFT